MIFTETPLKGAYVIDPERLEDERGFFARTWCQREFEKHGLDTAVAQCSISFNKKMGTLRGMHYQIAPHAEQKLVRCTAGIIYDVIVDLCPKSRTFRQWFATELSVDNRRMLYIPEGFAHGFLTLTDNTEVYYQISEYHVPDSSRGVRWNDPAFAISWPEQPRIVSQRDSAYADFTDF
jgi:dTDP-4-dehydrorhamnose 3,5-epimerase